MEFVKKFQPPYLLDWRRLGLGVLMLLGLTACATRQPSLVEFSSGDRLQSFLDPEHKEMRVYMSDGDILKGKYIKTSNARFRFGAGVHVGGGSTSVGSGLRWEWTARPKFTPC